MPAARCALRVFALGFASRSTAALFAREDEQARPSLA
jgi:hypothetical protein